jgi:hypothetical protein
MLALLQGQGLHLTARDLGEQDGYGLGPGIWDHARLMDMYA